MTSPPADGPVATLATVKCSKGRRLKVAWGLGNDLRLCEVKAKSSGAVAPSTALGEGSGGGFRHANVVWGWQNAAERRVCYECLPHWLVLQKRRVEMTEGARGTSAPSWNDLVLNYSRTVAGVLSKQEDLSAFQTMRVVWELLEVFYVSHPPNSLDQVQGLVAWLQRNCEVLMVASGLIDSGSLPSQRIDEMASSAFPELEPSYWPTVSYLASLGLCEIAIDILGAHSAWQRWQNKDRNARSQFEVLESLITILQKLPRLSPGASLHSGFGSVSEFTHFRAKWLAACRQLLANEALWQECAAGDAATADGAQSVLRALAGDEEALSGAAVTWAEMLCSHLVHRYPTVASLSELGALFELCTEAKPGGMEGGVGRQGLTGLAAGILEAILSDNVQQVVALCSRSLGPWFMAHVTELLCGRPDLGAEEVLRRRLVGRQGDQCEHFVVDFVEALMTDASAWQTVCEYLAWCPTCGEGALAQFLTHFTFHLGDDRNLLVALGVARRHGMMRVATSLCRMQGLSRWWAGHTGSAVRWLREAGDSRRLRQLVRDLVRHIEARIMDDGLPSHGPLVDATLLNDVLAPEGDPHQVGGQNGALLMLKDLQLFHAKLGAALVEGLPRDEARGEANAAKRALMELVSDLAPRRLWLALLSKAVPLLEAEPAMFTSHEVVHLMHSLQQVSLSHDSEALLEGYHPRERLEAKLSAVNLALSRALARAIMAPSRHESFESAQDHLAHAEPMET